MGGWKLEVFKMALYVTFPVAMFHYFNQPEYFEEWVVKTKREMYPPINTQAHREFEEALRKIKEEQNLAYLAELEKS